jgi:methyl-accepting chemotaxis protein
VLVARNRRLRQLFLFDARRMLLSLMCADECSVVWPYLLKSGDTDGEVAPSNLEMIRAEFAAVVEERRRREPVIQIAILNDVVSGQAGQIYELTNLNVELTKQNAKQTNEIAEQSNQIAEQTDQIADLQAQVHALSNPRKQEPSSNAVDVRDKRAAKRRRTNR